MTDNYLPPSTTNCGNPRRDSPQIGSDGGARIGLEGCTPSTGSQRALPSVFEFVLPWPPSDNHYYTVARGRKILATKGRLYREVVRARAFDEKWPNFNRARVAVEFEVWMPDKRRRDIANILKAACDSLTYAGVWHDDSQIDDLRIYRAKALGGMLKARIYAAEAL